MSTAQNINFETITFKDSKAAQSRPDFYMPVTLNINAVLKSWQFSVFSFEWINKDASVKPLDALKERDQQKRQAVESKINNNEPIEKPVLGLGIQDTIEIGSGKAVLCTLAALGIQTIPVHIPKSNESDFKDLMAEVNS